MFDSTVSSDVSAQLEMISEPVSAERVRTHGAIARQHTIKSSFSCTGVGLHSGTKTTLTMHPAEAGTGIRFRRVDAKHYGAVIPASWSNVTDTRLNTCISNEQGVSVKTIEHLMSALAGMGVDN